MTNTNTSIHQLELIWRPFPMDIAG